MKRPADVMVSETFDAGLIGENFLSILTHAKKYKLIKKNAVIIPNSATIYGQLFESTFSLQKKNNNDNNHVHVNKFNITLEPMRKYRLANKYTVRYLNERNAVRQTLTKPIPLFDYDFQNYDI